MAADDSRNKEITALEKRLAELDRERASLLSALDQLRQPRSANASASVRRGTIG